MVPPIYERLWASDFSRINHVLFVAVRLTPPYALS